jgi:hypothetical protein
MPNPHAAQFAGRWIGETQSYDMPAHIWDIRVLGEMLQIESRWEDETVQGRMSGKMLPDQAAFAIGNHTAVLVDAQHFIIRGWDTNDTRGGVGPDYDVVFSRPGLAELQAAEIWRVYVEGDKRLEIGD